MGVSSNPKSLEEEGFSAVCAKSGGGDSLHPAPSSDGPDILNEEQSWEKERHTTRSLPLARRYLYVSKLTTVIRLLFSTSIRYLQFIKVVLDIKFPLHSIDIFFWLFSRLAYLKFMFSKKTT